MAWPKRASGVETDMHEGVLREVALPLGLVDNKVCAIDETWTGMRVVWRRERRGLSRPRSGRPGCGVGQNSPKRESGQIRTSTLPTIVDS